MTKAHERNYVSRRPTERDQSRALAVRKRVLLCLACTLMFTPARAAEPGWLLDSGETRVTLLELYSSEGCSSCPPAEHWIGGLRTRSDLWRRLVPLNLHVSYWDRLGWRDPYASPENTERQYRYVRHLGIGSPYTPGFFVNGREWRGFFEGRRLTPDPAVPVGPLRLAIHEDEIRAEFLPAAASGDVLELHVAVLGFDLSSDVRAGENRGRRLVQNFVVLALETERTQLEGGLYAWQLELPLPRDEWPPDVGLASWVTLPDDPTPIQAVGGELRKNAY